MTKENFEGTKMDKKTAEDIKSLLANKEDGHRGFFSAVASDGRIMSTTRIMGSAEESIWAIQDEKNDVIMKIGPLEGDGPHEIVVDDHGTDHWFVQLDGGMSSPIGSAVINFADDRKTTYGTFDLKIDKGAKLVGGFYVTKI
ncbi:hypothetical protein ACIP86_01980 [Pseudomonas neuropathica]